MAEAGPLKVDTGPNEPASPPIAALFLVKFDQRKGYVVAWHKALDGGKLPSEEHLGCF